jgi:hypothetical protein
MHMAGTWFLNACQVAKYSHLVIDFCLFKTKGRADRTGTGIMIMDAGVYTQGGTEHVTMLGAVGRVQGRSVSTILTASFR